MPIEAPVPFDHPMMEAWTAYCGTDEYCNSSSYAMNGGPFLSGAMWAAFTAGFKAATERAASLHESVDPASGTERQSGSPGADAMGAVIQYRDLIRQQGVT